MPTNNFSGVSDATITKTSTEVTANASNKEAKTNPSTKDGKKNRVHRTEPVYAVMIKARAQFNKQVRQDTETKILCIEKNIPTYYPDAARFWADFRKEREDLMDSRRFVNYCSSMGKTPEYVAENVIFEGKSAKKQILAGELDKVLNQRINLFVAPLFQDPNNLYSDPNATENTENVA